MDSLTTQSEQSTIVDIIKLLAAAALLIGGLFGYYYYLELSLPLRVLMVLGGFGSGVAMAMTSMQGKMILDVGCGNGYYSLRMQGDGAKSVIGIDPSMLFMMQFKAIMHFMQSVPVFLLPLKLEELPCNTPIFDTAFSMGVLYHQRSPLEHLNQLYGALKKNGELILETIIFPGNDTYFRNENGRYAQMPNVWHLPNIKELYSWLKMTGFKNIKKGRIEITTTDEQRSTEWMTSHSLSNALDPVNKKLTIEGFPAPHRIIIACNK
ncbi:tRNA 5-methoxyuridine(34)/uridine 5-oxyacetic acid(34) synthase CmoB [Woeseiaceae bacterium]|nr:tRNA 5-methoxyuridine(34)/uridine 5-oxyacetic acid(34) synthase CmoB [Woeseiaceae bacterium]